MTFRSLSLSPQLIHHQAILDYPRLSLVQPFLHYAKQPDLQWETRPSSITHYLVSPWSPTAQSDYLEMRLYQPWSTGELGLGSEIGTCNYSVGFSNVQAHPQASLILTIIRPTSKKSTGMIGNILRFSILSTKDCQIIAKNVTTLYQY